MNTFRDPSSSNIRCYILDIPDEILVKMISHFDTRKRLALASTCTRFDNLIFGDEELMRELDFSKNGRLTRFQDIRRYFRDEKSRDLVRKVNIQNVNCMRGGKMLNDSIGKALKLVEVNVHGVKFRDVKELGNFLEPLINLKRLSVDWPKPAEELDDVKISRKILQKPLSRLSFFSVKVFVYSVEFLPNIKLCEELEELRMITTESSRHMRRMSWDLDPSKLRRLKIVQVRGPQAMQMKKHLVNILLDPQEWTDFQLIDISREPGFYLEKDVEVCEELKKTKLMKQIPYQRENPPHDIGWFLISEYLLKEVIEITHEDALKTFCCLTAMLKPLEQDKEPCLLKIDEAKRLLKDPRHQVSFLYFKHSIDENCDAHLVASAFPNLAKLVLYDVIKSNDTVSTWRKKKRLRRRGSISPEEEDADDLSNQRPYSSSFEMLVGNTPHLKNLVIYAQNDFDEKFNHWDLDALYLIPRWKNLRTLCLAFVPIKDGKFLIEIGKECPKLERVVLHYLGNGDPNSCYANDLSQMLRHCKNLKEFSIKEHYLENIPEVLASLSNNLKLKKFSCISSDERYKFFGSEELILSVEKLLYSCGKLITFVFIIEPLFQEDSIELVTALKRIRKEWNRPDFQFQIVGNDYHSRNGSEGIKAETVHEDASPSFFPWMHNGFDFE